MASTTRVNSAQAPVPPKTTLADLRRAAGYRNSKDFAVVLGIPATTYSRYERTIADQDSGIPIRAAWAIADRLHCSIDAVVGRSEETADDTGRDLNAIYRGLSESGKERLDEYLQFLDLRDRMIATQGR